MPVDQQHCSNPIWLLISFQKARLIAKGYDKLQDVLSVVSCVVEPWANWMPFSHIPKICFVNYNLHRHPFGSKWSLFLVISSEVITLCFLPTFVFLCLLVCPYAWFLVLFFSFFKEWKSIAGPPGQARTDKRGPGSCWGSSVGPWFTFPLLLATKPQILTSKDQLSAVIFFSNSFLFFLPPVVQP